MIRLIAPMLLLLAAGPLAADGLGKVSATGSGFSNISSSQGRLMAERAAKVDAYRQLTEIIDGVQITAGTKVKDLMLESDTIGARVKGFVQGAVQTGRNSSRESDGWLSEVELTVCLNAGPAECSGRPTLTQLTQPVLAVPDEEDMFDPAPAEVAAVEVVAQATGASGLIVDVTGKDFSPLLDVRVRTSTGKEVYGPGHVTKGTDWLHWANSMSNAKGMTNVVGDSPLTISVDSIGPDAELIVTNDDAINIFKANVENDDFLKSGKVVFIVGG